MSTTHFAYRCAECWTSAPADTWRTHVVLLESDERDVFVTCPGCGYSYAISNGECPEEIES